MGENHAHMQRHHIKIKVLNGKPNRPGGHLCFQCMMTYFVFCAFDSISEEYLTINLCEFSQCCLFIDSGAPLIEGAIEQTSISKSLFYLPSLYVKKHIIKIGPIINWSIETFFVRLNNVLPVNFLSAKIILN